MTTRSQGQSDPWAATLLHPLESAINRALDKSPATRVRLKALANTCLTIELPIAHLQLNTDGDKLTVSRPAQDGVPDCTLITTPLTLARLLLVESEPLPPQSHDVKVVGDKVLLEQWLVLGRHIDVDWEALLAEHLGDIPAHLMGRTLRGSSRWGRNLNTSLLSNLEEYLVEEARLLPTRSEQQYQQHQINALSDTVDALEARLQALTDRLSDRRVGTQTKDAQ